MTLHMSYEDGLREIDAFFASPPASPEALSKEQNFEEPESSAADELIVLPGLHDDRDAQNSLAVRTTEELPNVQAQSLPATDDVEEFATLMQDIDQVIANADDEQTGIGDQHHSATEDSKRTAAEASSAGSDTNANDISTSADYEGISSQAKGAGETGVSLSNEQLAAEAPSDNSQIDHSEQHNREPSPAQLESETGYHRSPLLFQPPQRVPQDSSSLRRAPNTEIDEDYVLPKQAPSAHPSPMPEIALTTRQQKTAEPPSSGSKAQLFAEMRDEDNYSRLADQTLPVPIAFRVQPDVGPREARDDDAVEGGGIEEENTDAPGSAVGVQDSLEAISPAPNTKEFDAAEGLARLSQGNVLQPLESSPPGRKGGFFEDKVQDVDEEALVEEEEEEEETLPKINSPMNFEEPPRKKRKKDSRTTTKPRPRHNALATKQGSRRKDRTEQKPAMSNFEAAEQVEREQKPRLVSTPLSEDELSSGLSVVPGKQKKLTPQKARKENSSNNNAESKKRKLDPVSTHLSTIDDNPPSEPGRKALTVRRKPAKNRLGGAEMRMMQYNTLLDQDVGPRQTRHQSEKGDAKAAGARDAKKAGDGATTVDAAMKPTAPNPRIEAPEANKPADSSKKGGRKAAKANDRANEEGGATASDVTATMPAARIQNSGTFPLGGRDMRGLFESELLAGAVGSGPRTTRFQKGEQAKKAPNASGAAKARHRAKDG